MHRRQDSHSFCNDTAIAPPGKSKGTNFEMETYHLGHCTIVHILSAAFEFGKVDDSTNKKICRKIIEGLEIRN